MATTNLNFTITANTASANAAVASLATAVSGLVGVASRPLPNQFGGIQAGAAGATSTIGGLHLGLSRLQSLALSFVGFGFLKDQLNELGEAIQKQQTAMSRLKFANDGDARKAADDYAFLRQQAERLGQPLGDAANAYGNLAAATKGTALQGAATRQIFLGVAEASTVLKLSADDTKGAFLALQQMVSKGKVSAEEFRQQLGERVPVALEAGARALGVTRTEFTKLLDSGSINSESFLPKFAEELRKLSSSELPEATQSFVASKSRLENALLELRQRIGEGELGTKLQGAIDAAAKALRDPNLQEGLQLLSLGFARAIEWSVKLVAFVSSGAKSIGKYGALAASEFSAAFESVVPKITEVFNKVVAALKRSFAGALETLAKGASTVGNNSLAESLYDTATSIRRSADENVKAAAEARKKLAGIDQFNKDRKKGIRDYFVQDLIAPQADTGKGPTPGITNLPTVKPGPKEDKGTAKRESAALEAYLKAFEDYAVRNAKATREQAQAELDAGLQKRLLSQKEYLQKKAQLDLAEIDQEVQARRTREKELQAKVDAPKTPKEERLKAAAELIKIQSEIRELDGKQVNVGVKLDADLYLNGKAITDLQGELQASLLDALGSTAASAKNRLAKETADLLSDPRVVRSGLEPLVKQLDAAKAVLIDLAEASKQANTAIAQLGFSEQSIQRQVTTGQLSEIDGQNQIREARLKTAEAIKSQVLEAERLAALTGDPAQIQQANQLRQQYEDLATTMNQSAVSINESFFGSIKQGLQDISKGTKSWGDLVINVISSVLSKLGELALNQAISGLQSSMGGAAGGLGGFLSGLFGFADGGKVSGPGTGRSDSILAWLSNGEHVINAESAAAIGHDTLNYMNRYGALPARSAGSAVGGGGLGGSTTVDNHVNVRPNVTISTRDIIDGLRQDPEFERFHVQLSLNNRRRING